MTAARGAILLLLVVSATSGDGDICNKDHKYLESCMKTLPPLLSRDGSQGIPATKPAVDAACKAFKTGMQCIDEYATKCMDGDARKLINSNVAGARHHFISLCDDPVFQEDYLEHASCYKTVSRDWDACAHNFEQRVGHTALMPAYTRGVEVCCAQLHFAGCVYEAGRRRCSEEAALLLRNIARTLSNVRAYNAECLPGGETPGAGLRVCSGARRPSPLLAAALLAAAARRIAASAA